MHSAEYRTFLGILGVCKMSMSYVPWTASIRLNDADLKRAIDELLKEKISFKVIGEKLYILGGAL